MQRILASRRVFPNGSQSGLRMLNDFIYRAGKGLEMFRRVQLEKTADPVSEESVLTED